MEEPSEEGPMEGLFLKQEETPVENSEVNLQDKGMYESYWISLSDDLMVTQNRDNKLVSDYLVHNQYTVSDYDFL